MALMACCGMPESRASVRAVVALGLPTQAEGLEYKYRFLSGCTLPKLFLSGDHDEYGPREVVERVFARAPEPKRLVIVEGADHFFTGQLDQVASAINDWLDARHPKVADNLG